MRVPTSSEARRNGSKGGKASGRSRRALKTFKEALMDGLTPEEQKVMNEALKRNAMRGNLPAYEFLLKMMGQHPDQENGGIDHTITVMLHGGEDYGD